MRSALKILVAGLIATFVAGQSRSAMTNDVQQFYTGKQITFFIGTSPGGGYDLYARTLAQFLPAQIPGHPTIIVQNRAGGSGLGLTNSVYNAMPKDGTVLAISPVAMVLSEVLEPQSLSYKSQNFGWVGTMSTMTDI